MCGFHSGQNGQSVSQPQSFCESQEKRAAASERLPRLATDCKRIPSRRATRCHNQANAASVLAPACSAANSASALHTAPAYTTPTGSTPTTFFAELRHLLRLGLPIALVQLGTTSLNLVDVAMLGHHEPLALPAMALGNTLVWGALMFCMGVCTAVDPLLSQAVGAGDRAAIPRVLGRALLLAILLSLPTALLLLPATTWLTLAGQPAELLAPAAAYARIQAFGLLPFLAYGVLRSLLSAHARTLPQVLTIVAGNLLNLLLDWLLIYGHWGLPALGAAGASLATVGCRVGMLAGLLWFGRADLWPHLRALREPAVRRAVLAIRPLWALLRLGAPIGGQFVLEMGVFAATALLIGNLDAAAAANGPGLAGHQIALQLASLSFMVPLGLGLAASVRVGWAVGAGNHGALRTTVGAALGTGAAVMSAFMIVFLCLPEVLARQFGPHGEALAVAATLIPIAGVFQIGDGLQVVAIGCLRGLGDVRSPLWANVVGFWLVGLPLGCWFAYGCGAGPAGLWWGLVVGLFVVAGLLLLALRWRLLERRERLVLG